MRDFRAIAGLCLSMTVGLTGCFSTTRSVQKLQAPESYQTSTVEELEKAVSDRDAGITTVNAQVLVTATTGGSRTGEEKEYTALKGYIFVQKPGEMRLLLQKPLIGSRALDMVTDGKTFTLVRASLSGPDVWMQGTNTVTKPSKNALENLRPGFFLDALLVAGVKPEEYVTLTESTKELAPETRRHDAVLEPVYDLTVLKPKGGKVMLRQRTVRIDRVSGLPFEQDLYDDGGRVVTVATYENYQAFGKQQFPMLVTIKRPVDEYVLKIQVTKLKLNETFEADQFQLAIPDGVKVQTVE